MGNVPISCCRSRSPGPGDGGLESQGGARNGVSAKYSSSSGQESRRKLSNKYNSKDGDGNQQQSDHMAFVQHQQPNMLQHISEREPDDSETDPSSNVLNRPIFATRSSGSRHSKLSVSGNYIDSYSSCNSLSARKQSSGPLTSSQDQGYNSCASPNICTSTQTNEGATTDLTINSFGSSIQPDSLNQQVVLADQSTIEFASSSKLDKTNPTSGKNNETLFRQFTTTTTKPLNLSDEIQDDVTRATTITSANSDRTFNRQQQLDYTSQNIDGRTFSDNRPKASSCSTIFIDDSTISQPDLDQTIRCVSLAIYYHIKNRSSDITSDIFDESIHPFKTPCEGTQAQQQSANANQRQQQQQATELIILDSQRESSNHTHTQIIQEPDQTDIYNFVRTLFKLAQLTSEYAITTLVYLERLMAYGEIDLTPKTWRRMFLGAILLSSKVWEDQAVWNVDYAQILDEISVDDINELERQYLELIQFNMNVPSSVYAKYYFHLRTLALKNGLSENQTIMSVGRAKKLEAMSRLGAVDDYLSSPIHRKSPPAIKKHTSLEKLRLSGHSRAVLM